MTKTKSLKQTTLLVIIALCSAALGIWISQNLWEKQLPRDLDTTFLPQGKALPDFKLIDHDEHGFGLANLKGKWSFMFFGYTNCPDICPITMKVMEQAWQQIPPELLKDSQMIFVSVDRQRDSPEKLKSYAQYFHKDFIGVTGEVAQLDLLTRQIGILYGFEDAAPGSEEYLVNHSAQVVLIDPDTKLRAVFSPPHEGNKIAHTYQQIREFASN